MSDPTNGEVRKVWFKKNGKAWECYAARPPYRREDVIEEGVKYEVWITLRTHEGELKDG